MSNCSENINPRLTFDPNSKYPFGKADLATTQDFPEDYGSALSQPEEPEDEVGIQLQSTVIVSVLVLLWLYTIAMFIRRSRFLRTTGQRQSTYKSGLPSAANAAVAVNPSSRRQSLNASKRKQSQSKTAEISVCSDVSRDSVSKYLIPDKHHSATSLDDNLLRNHVASTPSAKKTTMKISLPSWRIERSRVDTEEQEKPISKYNLSTSIPTYDPIRSNPTAQLQEDASLSFHPHPKKLHRMEEETCDSTIDVRITTIPPDDNTCVVPVEPECSTVVQPSNDSQITITNDLDLFTSA